MALGDVAQAADPVVLEPQEPSPDVGQEPAEVVGRHGAPGRPGQPTIEPDARLEQRHSQLLGADAPDRVGDLAPTNPQHVIDAGVGGHVGQRGEVPAVVAEHGPGERRVLHQAQPEEAEHVEVGSEDARSDRSPGTDRPRHGCCSGGR